MRYLFALLLLCPFAAFAQLPLSAFASHTDASCNGIPDGTATVTATDGTPPYDYLWLPGLQTTSTISGLSAGTYICIVSDAAADTVRDTVVIAQPNALTATYSQTNLFCYGTHTGIASALVSGGSLPYSYSWAPTGGTSANATGLSGGVYTCTITDGHGCITTVTVTITEPSPIVASVFYKDIKCHGDSTGSIDLSVSGGSPPYTYAWLPPVGTGPSLSGLPAGVYTCNITDQKFCVHQEVVTIADVPALTTVDSQSNLLCFEDYTGYARVTASGGTFPYSYAWSPAVSGGPEAINLAADTLICTVTDINNCMRSDTFVITQPEKLTLHASKKNINCAGLFDGYVIVAGRGGTLPYTYAWTPPNVNDSIITNLAPGTYSCEITDSNGCKHDTALTIVDTSGLLSYTANSFDVGCRSARLTADADKGSRPGMQYLWSFSDDDTASGNPVIHTFPTDSPNSAMVVVIDSVGCADTVKLVVNINYIMKADFDKNPDVSAPNKPVTFISTSFKNATIFNWDFGDGTTATGEQALRIFSDSGMHHVCLIASDTNACADTVCKDVLIDADKIIAVPTAFSPNGDGENDMLFAHGFRIASFHMRVLDRWGKVMFETEKLNAGWDGRYKDMPQPADTYGYIIEVAYTDGTTEKKSGNVTLLR